MGFDEIVHQPTRLRLMAYLASLGPDARVEFGTLKRALDLTEGNLSRHLARLEEAGYVAIEKGYVNKRPRTWVRLTGRGRDAFYAHVDYLKRLLEGGGG